MYTQTSLSSEQVRKETLVLSSVQIHKPYTLSSPAGHTQEIGIGRFWELCPRYIGIPLANSLCRYGFDINHHIGFLGVWRGQLLKLKKYMPSIMTTVVDPVKR